MKNSWAPAQMLMLLLAPWLSADLQAQALDAEGTWDRDAAMNVSQAAIGQSIDDFQLVSADGHNVRLSDYAGKPVLISLIFTSCHHVCPMTTKRLATAVGAAAEVLGEDSFQVLTIGFDTPRDTPQAMRAFARKQAINFDNWDFLSADKATMSALVSQLGFVYRPSAGGFEHITQVSVLDRKGVVYRQVYGMDFELPWLVEPLKELVFNRPESAGHMTASLLDRIRLFCTVYDPSSGRYHFDYSLFIQMAIGLAAIVAVMFFLVNGMRRARGA